MLVAGMALAGCRPAPAPTADENITNQVVQPDASPVVQPPIDRTRLLTLVAQAASASAAGADNSKADRALDGKRFEVRMRFGCGESAAADRASGWTLDRDKKTLRIKAVPDLSKDDPVVRRLAGLEGAGGAEGGEGAEAVEAVEGFWIKRPWLLTAACPAPLAPVAEAKP